MKKLSDYKGDEAIELWADLLEPIDKILSDDKVVKVIKKGGSKLLIAKEILKAHAKEATAILQRIDPEPLNGITVVMRLVGVLADIGENKEIASFFGYAEREKMEGESIGSPTENIEDAEK